MREILLKIAVVLVFFLNAAQGQNISFLQSKNIPLHIPTTGSSVTYHTFVSGDFNGDGKLDFVVSSTDLVLSSPMTSYLSAMLELGNGDGSFKSVDLPFAAKVIVATVPGAYDESLLAADVNNDGKLDLIIRIGTQTSLFLGNGDGSFQSGKLLPAFPLAIADFTKNGKSDLLVETGSLAADLKCGESSLNVYPGNGDGCRAS